MHAHVYIYIHTHCNYIYSVYLKDICIRGMCILIYHTVRMGI